MENLKITGIPAAPGLVIGPAYIMDDEFQLQVPRYRTGQPEEEWNRLLEALEKANREIEQIQHEIAQHVSPADRAIFDAHRMFLQDPELLDLTRQAINEDINAEAAWMESVEFFAGEVEQVLDETLSSRAADVRDVGHRVLGHLLGKEKKSDLNLSEPAIIIARDLTPSQTSQMDRSKVLGFCLAEGGPNSHTAILASGLGLPAVVAMGEKITQIEPATIIILNGNNGEVIFQPDDAALKKAQQEIVNRKVEADSLVSRAHQPAETSDGHQVEVVANIATPEDATAAVESGAEGVGLFRTEFLFLHRQTQPSLVEQTASYQKVFETLDGKPLVVRLLDIGGDKEVPYLGKHNEANPFLGWRAVRMVDEYPELYEQQLEALLRAASEPSLHEKADLRIMVPMISAVEEVQQMYKMLKRVKKKLKGDFLHPKKRIQFGIMIEVPSAAILADKIAPLVDFFSIGTNDLSQYILAVDRSNAKVANLASTFHPAVLRMIDLTIQSAHAVGKWVGLCGEFASESLAAPLLIGLGLNEFSMAPARIPVIKELIRSLSVSECRLIAKEALQMSTASDVVKLVKERFPSL